MRFALSTPHPIPAADGSHGGNEPFANLPEWDLTDLYPAPDAPEFARDLAWLHTECAGFAADFQGKLAGLDAAGLLACVTRYEQIDITSMALDHYGDMGLEVPNFSDRMRCCALHIGLVHLAYNAFLGDLETLRLTDERMSDFLA